MRSSRGTELSGQLRPRTPGFAEVQRSLIFAKVPKVARFWAAVLRHESACMLARVAVVTGANRGLGLALAESLAESGTHVVLAARDEQLCTAAAAALATSKGVSVEAVQLDVQCGRSIEAFGAYCEQTFGGIDLLVNNAAVCEAGWSEAVVGRALRTNVLGPRALTRRMLPALRERPHAQVLHISSGDGELLYLSPELQRQMAAVDTERALLRLLAAARPLRNA